MRAATLLCVFQVKFLRLPSDASHGRRGGSGRGATALPIRTPRRGVPTSWPRLAQPSLRGKSVCHGEMGMCLFRRSANSISQNQVCGRKIAQKRVPDGTSQMRLPARRPVRALSAGICLMARLYTTADGESDIKQAYPSRQGLLSSSREVSR